MWVLTTSQYNSKGIYCDLVIICPSQALQQLAALVMCVYLSAGEPS